MTRGRTGQPTGGHRSHAMALRGLPPRAAAAERFSELTQGLGEKYLAIVKLWRKACRFTKFLALDGVRR